QDLAASFFRRQAAGRVAGRVHSQALTIRNQLFSASRKYEIKHPWLPSLDSRGTLLAYPGKDGIQPRVNEYQSGATAQEASIGYTIAAGSDAGNRPLALVRRCRNTRPTWKRSSGRVRTVGFNGHGMAFPHCGGDVAVQQLRVRLGVVSMATVRPSS